MITLAEFRDTRREVNMTEAESILGQEIGGCKAMMIYSHDCWIAVMDDGKYWLNIERDEWLSDDLASLEAILYTIHFASECGDEWTLDAVADIRREFARLSLPTQCEWSEWFSEWVGRLSEDVQRRADGVGFGNRA